MGASMLSRQTKAGLVLAFILGISDIAILGSLGDSSGSQPPVGVVVASVMIGVATLMAVVAGWRSGRRNLILTVVALRVLSGLGDLIGFGGDSVVVAASALMLLVTVVDLYLLREYVGRPSTPKLGSV